MRLRALALAGLLGLLPLSSHAVQISFTDTVGDHTGSIDATGLTLDFDSAGVYTIEVSADAANPFLGEFRINVNLFNTTLDEFFQDSFNDFDLATAQTSITLTGTSSVLTDWLPAHVIATSTLDGLGNPTGISFFRTSVADLPFQGTCAAEDVIGSAGCVPVAEPDALALGALALAAPLFAATGRRLRRRESVTGHR